eukprot:1093398-Amorphochlora_amoeboformis.AAC.1
MATLRPKPLPGPKATGSPPLPELHKSVSFTQSLSLPPKPARRSSHSESPSKDAKLPSDPEENGCVFPTLDVPWMSLGCPLDVPWMFAGFHNDQIHKTFVLLWERGPGGGAGFFREREHDTCACACGSLWSRKGFGYMMVSFKWEVG